MEYSPSWEADRGSTTWQTPAIYETRRFIRICTGAGTESIPGPDEPSPNPHALFVKINLSTFPVASVQVRGLVQHFATRHVLKMWGSMLTIKPSSWRTTPCRVSAILCSIFLQLPTLR